MFPPWAPGVMLANTSPPAGATPIVPCMGSSGSSTSGPARRPCPAGRSAAARRRRTCTAAAPPSARAERPPARWSQGVLRADLRLAAGGDQEDHEDDAHAGPDEADGLGGEPGVHDDVG